MNQEDAISAAILGELIPELEYAAPLLLERVQRGDPLAGATPPTDVGFETGALDSVLLEFFKALVPYVKTALTWGVLSVVQGWLLAEREARHHAELVEKLEAQIEVTAELQEPLERIADVLSRIDGRPVSRREIVHSIAAATDRVSKTDDHARRG